MGIQVLLPTSGTGSRLQELTQFTNKSLVPVGDKYAICHIIEWYPQDTEFVITLGYKGNLVKDFLELVYPDKKFQFVWVDTYEGPGSSLAYSILNAKEFLQKPFYFHCCDTLFDKEEPFQALSKNTLIVTPTTDPGTYATITTRGTTVKQLYKKGASEFEYAYTGVSFLQDAPSFWTELERIYVANPADQSLSDIHAVQSLLEKGVVFDYQVSQHVYDTGNKARYEEICAKFPSSYDILAKPNESLCFLGSSVIKFNADTKVNTKRYKRGVLLSPLVPRMYEARDNFIQMEFCKGRILSEVHEYGEVKRLLVWAKQNLWTQTKTDPAFYDACMKFYKVKTLERLKGIPFLGAEASVINGMTIPPMLELLEKVDFARLCQTTFTRFHGDFILDNILKTESSYVLLDWRHEFDTQLEYGDMYYDLAKLRHNIIFNHKNITNGLFTVKKDASGIYVDLKCNYFLMNQLDDLETFVKGEGYDNNIVKVLSSLIWINMAPLYEDPLREFLFYFGKWNLWLNTGHTGPSSEQHPIAHL